MAAELSKGFCEHCRRPFGYQLCHSGLSTCRYAYCDSCGKTAILDEWDKSMPALDCPAYSEICSEVEPYLLPCDCGGRFKPGSQPRCPHCREPLSAARAASYIEANAPGAAKGWRWQKSWSGLYWIVIENNYVEDNFRYTGSAELKPRIRSADPH